MTSHHDESRLKLCSHCRRPLSDDDRFCAHCGTAIHRQSSPALESVAEPPPQIAPPPAPGRKPNGSPLAKSARRGRAARSLSPAPLDEPASVTARRSANGQVSGGWFRRVILLCLLGLLAVTGYRLYQGWFAEPPPDSVAETPTDPSMHPGPPLEHLPAEVLTHPEGGILSLPSRAVASHGTVRWEPVPTPEALRGLPLTAPVMRFENDDSLAVLGRITLDLPLGDSERGAVLVQAGFDTWVPLPSTPVELPDGRRGLRVEIDGEPAPWLVAITSRHDIADAVADPLVRELLDIEQRVWTHKSETLVKSVAEESAAQKTSGLKISLAMGPAPDISALLQEAEAKQNIIHTWRAFREVSRLVGDQPRVQRQMMRGLNPFNEAWPVYCEGVTYLAQLQAQPADVLKKATFQAPGWFLAGRPAPGDATVPTETAEFWQQSHERSVWDLVQILGAEYTPWGADFVQFLIKAIPSRDNAPIFDLRVLPKVGELEFVDVEWRGPIQLSERLEQHMQTALGSKFVAGQSRERRSLRLFSPATVNIAWDRWLLELTDDRLLRWGPVLYGTVHFFGMAGTTTLTGGMSLLGAFSWALVQEAVDIHNEIQDVAGEVYVRTDYVETLLGEGGVAMRDVITHYKGGRLRVGPLKFTANLSDLRLNAYQMVVSGGVAWMLQEKDSGLLKEISKIPTGFPGYDGTSLPPVLLSVDRVGMLNQPEGPEVYPVEIAAVVRYAVDFQALSQTFPGDRLRSAGDNQNETADLRPLRFRHYRSEGSELGLTETPTPDEQLLRFGVPEEVIQRRMVDLGMNLSDDWKTVPFDQLGLSVSLRSLDGAIRVLTPVIETTQPQELAGNTRYGAIRLHAAGKPLLPPGFVGIPAAYRGSVQQIEKVRQRYEVLLAAIPVESDLRTAIPLTTPVVTEVLVKAGPHPAVQHLAVLTHIDPAKPPEQLWYLQDLGLLTPVPSTVDFRVTPEDLSRAHVGRPYLLKAQAIGISPRIESVKIHFQFPDDTAREYVETPSGGATFTTHDKIFERPVSGTLTVDLIDIRQNFRLARVQIPVHAQSVSKPNILYTELAHAPSGLLLPPMNPDAGTPGGVSSVSRLEATRELYFTNLVVPRESPHGDDPISWNQLRLIYQPDGSIDDRGGDQSPSFRGKVEDYKITLTIKVPAEGPYEIGTQRFPGKPAAERTWVFDK